MNCLKLLLIIFLILFVIPLFSVLLLSFQNNNLEIFQWYDKITHDEQFIRALILSFFISTISATLSVLISFFISLSWFNAQQRNVIFIIVLILGLIPPDIFSLSIIKIPQLFGVYTSNLFFLVLGLLFYCVPFAILLFWSRFFFIANVLLISGSDIGLTKINLIIKIILPLSKATLISVFALSFLLSFNEFSRTSYLSGSYILLSEYLFGKLSTGTDPSIFAGGSITIGIVLIVILSTFSIYGLFDRATEKMSKKGNAKTKID